MKFLNVYLFIWVYFTNVEAVRDDLPSYFPRCWRFDPNLNQCLLNATETVKPFLVKGVPELNIPSIDPFYLPEVTLQQGTQALNFKATLKNIRATGLSTYKFKQFDFDVPNLQFFCNAEIGHLDLDGDYSVTGKILLAPLEGKGKFTASIDNSNIMVYQKIKIVQRHGGLDFVEPVTTNTTMKVGGPKAHLEGLFEGHEELNNATNRIINDNVDVLFEDLRPVIEQVVTKIVEDLLFKALEDNIPFDKLYSRTPLKQSINIKENV